MDQSYEERERREAVAAGKRALNSLQRAAEELDKAKNWGIVDLLGGGMISTYVKRSKMNNAQYYMNQAKDDLRAFCKELRDINSTANLNVQTGDFLTFADYFFDGFLADFFVQDKINQARNQVAEASRRVTDILKQIRA